MQVCILKSLLRAFVLGMLLSPYADAACGYFSAKNADILQPAQKVFIPWNPTEKLETFTVQPKFEGNAIDFGMVIPTPSQPKLHEMPRNFFKHLAVYSILRKREFAQSGLLPKIEMFGAQTPPLLARAGKLNFKFVAGQRPRPNAQGHIPTTMEWARRLSKNDIDILMGKSTYSEKVLDPDEGFTFADAKDKARATAIAKIIRARDEMNDDLLLVPARYNGVEDNSEYEEILPTSPP